MEVPHIVDISSFFEETAVSSRLGWESEDDSDSTDGADAIHVVLRFRPESIHERRRSGIRMVDYAPYSTEVTVGSEVCVSWGV
jgi:hypothetical protein